MATQSEKDYQKLHNISRKTKVLSGISRILEWDQETCMPPAGAQIRAEQLKVLAGMIHSKRTSKTFAGALGKLIDLETGAIKGEGLRKEQEAALQEWRHDYKRDTALPKRFVEAYQALTSQAIEVWKQAKKENDFPLLEPCLKKLIQMARKKADLLGYDEHPYDALLDLYEPHTTTKHVQALFTPLRNSIVHLLKEITSQNQVEDSFLHGEFDTTRQLEFAKTLMEAMGSDPRKTRLDLSTHPFSSASHPTDSRITTRIHPSSLVSNISVVLHEMGHSLYEMGLPASEYGSPLGESISLGIHESQSRWWETRIGLSKPFWQHWLPKLQERFQGPLQSISLETFWKGINKVEPSYIRVEADEVTYPLHVILRFELELALIEGKLKVKDLPEAWNGKMEELLGITPKTDTQGCLQDIHWSMGAFGYFPTYSLGNMYAAHLFLPFEKDHQDWEKRVSTGELQFILGWLYDKVHRHGRGLTSHGLMKEASGKEFTSEAYVKYLENKYNHIYGCRQDHTLETVPKKMGAL